MVDWIIVWLVVFAGVYLLQGLVNFFKDDGDASTTSNRKKKPHQIILTYSGQGHQATFNPHLLLSH